MESEIRTRRLVIEDETGKERIVAEVRQGSAELRLELPGTAPGMSTGVVCYATPDGMGSGIGVQLWANGDAIAELDAWPDELGRWEPHVFFGGGQ